MRTFNKFRDMINEDITRNEAIKLLNLDNNYTKNELKSNYRELSRKNHPDRGGDDEKMKLINRAYEILNVKKHQGTSIDWDKIRNDYAELRDNLNSIIKDSLNYKAFEDYFGEVFNEKFEVNDVKYWDNSDSYAGVNFSIDSLESDISLRFQAHIYLLNIKYANTVLSVDNLSVPIEITSNGFLGGKQFKLYNKLRDYDKFSTLDLSKDISKIFPKKKMITQLNKPRGKLTRKDFVSFFKHIMKAEHLGDDNYRVRLDTSNDLYESTWLYIIRSTFMRTANYSFKIYKKNPKDNTLYYPKELDINEFFHLYEIPQLMDFFIDFNKKYLKKKKKTISNTEILKISEDFMKWNKTQLKYVD